MTSLFMGQLVSTGVPADETVVRSTATPVEPDAPAAMQDDQPMPQEVETDPNPHLGMVNRTLASKWSEGVRATPAWIPQVDDTAASFNIIDEQVGTSGTAAAREASGITNKNLSYAIGIEPVGDLVDGHKMGNSYFERNLRPVQDTMRHEMTPANGSDRKAVGLVSQAGKTNARDAAIAAQYNAYWNEGK
jgi:hypothetical protein